MFVELLIKKIIDKKYKNLSKKEKKIFKLIKSKHLSKDLLIMMICTLLEANDEAEGQIALTIKNDFITKKESISSLRKSKSKNRELIQDKDIKKEKKVGRKEGDTNYTTEITKKIENGELKDGDIYNGLKIKIKKLECETECKDCGSVLVDTGLKQYTVKLDCKPIDFYISVIENPIMKCVNPECETNALHNTLINDPTKKGILTTNLIIEIIYQKYLLGVPIERLTKQYPFLNKKTVTASIMRLGQRLTGLIGYIEKDIFSYKENKIIYIDETYFPLTYMTHKEDQKTRKKAYFYCLGTDKTILFKATISRSAQWLREKLKQLDYDIYISSDDFSGYNFIKNDYHLLCNCHARRYFFEAVCTLPKEVDIEKSSCYQVLISYSKIFYTEKQIKDLSSEEKFKVRNSKEYQFLIDDLWKKVNLADGDSFAGSKNQKAVDYIKDNWNKLWNYRKNGDLKMENGTAENNIRKLCLIRNNSLIFNNESSAAINCNILSLVLTAQAYGLDVRKYLNYVFHMLPQEDENKGEKQSRKNYRTGRPLTVDYKDLVPWSENLYKDKVNYEI